MHTLLSADTRSSRQICLGRTCCSLACTPGRLNSIFNFFPTRLLLEGLSRSLSQMACFVCCAVCNRYLLTTLHTHSFVRSSALASRVWSRSAGELGVMAFRARTHSHYKYVCEAHGQMVSITLKPINLL
jgi:hypothetical protein